MRRHRASLAVFVVAAAVLSGGCQSMKETASRAAATIGKSAPIPRVVLAAYVSQPQQTQSSDTDPKSRETPTDQPVTDESVRRDQPTATEEETKAKEPALRGYTEPSAAIRQAALLRIALATSEDVTDIPGGGKELAEARLDVGPRVSGRSGLTPATPAVVGEVVSRAGLQEGAVTAIGFMSELNNILVPRPNTLSGSMGRCNDLANAGFFGRSVDNCVSHFSSRQKRFRFLRRNSLRSRKPGPGSR